MMASDTGGRGKRTDRAEPPAGFVPLDEEVRETISTSVLAYHVNRSEKTLYNRWSAGKGPIQPIRIDGRLAWRVADLRRLLGVQQPKGAAA